MECVFRCPVINTRALIPTLAWRRIGDISLSEPNWAYLSWRTYASLVLNDLINKHGQQWFSGLLTNFDFALIIVHLSPRLSLYSTISQFHSPRSVSSPMKCAFIRPHSLTMKAHITCDNDVHTHHASVVRGQERTIKSVLFHVQASTQKQGFVVFKGVYSCVMTK